MPPGETLAAYAATGATLAIHLAAAQLVNTLAVLTPHYGPDCPAALVVRASWPDERVIRGTIATLDIAGVERTALLLVGHALAATGFRDSALYSPDYIRRFRP
jgi:precorrin-4/cobalt-precorrin-4 C11-methyltransferase